MNGTDNPTCAACGEVSASAKARFCENCGRPLGAADAVAVPGVRGCRCAEPDLDAEGFCGTCGLRAGPAGPPPDPLPDYEESLDAGLALACDRGRRHATNDDYGAVARRADGTSLVVVCDGVSTSENAAGAAQAAVSAARHAFLAGEAASPGMTLEEQARACGLAASGAVVALDPKGGGDPESGAATTLVLAVVRDRAAAVAWAGDSRAYLVTPGVPEEQVTRDDSWCRMVVDAGRMTYQAALQAPQAHAITQWLGMPPDELELHVRGLAVPPRAALVLCSDGLWNYVDGGGLVGKAYAEASSAGDARETCRRLVALANAAGGRDNITVGIHVP